MQDVSVREMTVQDADEVLRIWYGSWLATYVRPELGLTHEWIEQYQAPRFTPEGKAHFVEWITSGVGKKQSNRFVAERDGQLVGLAAPFIQSKRGQRVGALYVAPGHEGTGVGSALMDAVLDFFDSSQPIHLEVAAFNERAIAFYEHFGFRRVPGSEQLFAEVIPEFWMVLNPKSDHSATTTQPKR